MDKRHVRSLFVLVLAVLAVGGSIGCGAGDIGTSPESVGEAVSAIDAAGGITAGGGHVCALNSSAGVACSGKNAVGQLGDGTTQERWSFVDVSGLTSGVAAVAAGNSHSCALTTSGGVKCWGYNEFGQLGNGKTTSSNTPVNVSGLSSGVTAVATGSHYSCALLSDSTMKCWGQNSSGYLGDGTTTNRKSPVTVKDSTCGSNCTLTGVSAIATGWIHACAVTTSGGLKCWGYNLDGRVGDGTTATFRSKAVNVSGLTSGVAEVSLGYHSCARTTGGGLKCWGGNGQGQLGNGTTTGSLVPADVSGLTSGVTSFDVSETHSCALTSGGGVKCWGLNNYGQLGTGNTTKQLSPVDVWGWSEDSGVSSLSAGYYVGGTTCAVMADTGESNCWGANTYGQFGDGSERDRWAPVDAGTAVCGDGYCTNTEDLTTCAADCPM